MSSRTVVLLVQLPIPPAGPEPVRGNVPLAAGYLKLVAERAGLGGQFAIDIFPTALANTCGDAAMVDAICARAPDLLGFTCYLWNVQRTLWIAARVKERRPQVRIVLGGPEITRDNYWVLGETAIDFAVFGEGEQTFVEFLGWWRAGRDSAALPHIIGLGFRDGAHFRLNAPRTPMSDLSVLSSPWIEGIVDAREHEQMLLETVRGCVFRCKFCYYPKAYDSQYFLDTERVRADLAHARACGVREVFLLDPTLNQRPDFGAFVELLVACNPDAAFELHGELRGEGITPKLAQRMRAANFVEVEVGLQSVDPHTQATMDRRNNLRAFEKGVAALREAGIRVKTDLIVGLPGDTVQSVRDGFRFLVDRGLCDIAQVFRLSILPGTAFRHEAEQLGLRFQARPPYSVLSTPALSEDDIAMLLAEAEQVFDCTFDPLPSAWFETPALPAALTGRMVIDLDTNSAPAEMPASSFVFALQFRARDPFAHRERIVATVRNLLVRDPFTTLLVVIETGSEFPLDLLDELRDAMDPAVDVYLDRHHEAHTGSAGAARRLAVLLPREQAFDADWLEALSSEVELVRGEQVAAQARG